MKNIAIFGANEDGFEVYKNLFSSSILSVLEYNFIFLDNDSRLKDSNYNGVSIFNPNEINLESLDLIVVGVIFFDIIRDQLIKLNYDENKIVRFYSEDFFSEKSRKVGLATIGKYSYFKPSVKLFNVEIGNYCQIAAGCRLGLIGHDINNLVTYPFNYRFAKDDKSLDCSNDDTSDPKKKKKKNKDRTWRFCWIECYYNVGYRNWNRSCNRKWLNCN